MSSNTSLEWLRTLRVHHDLWVDLVIRGIHQVGNVQLVDELILQRVSWMVRLSGI